MSQRQPPDDMALFRQLMGNVRPITHDRADLDQPKKSLTNAAARRKAAIAVDEQQIQNALSEGYIPPVTPSQVLDYAIPDLPWKTRQQLKKGQIPWEEGLDLHGYSIEKARHELASFVQDAHNQRFRCLLVVHGKSWSDEARYPVLKAHVNAWLRQMPEVLAFTSATPADGDTGAVYVLLKKGDRLLD
ncbi:DNA mismatch repair protein MutS [Terasakiispira papahanaumokuakeensis]|uniref:DNA mismatch repair protein MutS n=1 Tax=Terasakiispira papahanaumokuakeensis TaxID=197479 RepID=A0A1E2V8F5_9GAMM|nr:Smr/MutS family protein [Terasakiispira papahanaumokuakeensis]ODC03299.1 DNA mismatch repair protein MutS [Terasakiispira papahanaumokuakeensis]